MFADLESKKQLVQGLSNEFRIQIANKDIGGILDAHASHSLAVPSVPPYNPANRLIQNVAGESEHLTTLLPMSPTMGLKN